MNGFRTKRQVGEGERRNKSEFAIKLHILSVKAGVLGLRSDQGVRYKRAVPYIGLPTKKIFLRLGPALNWLHMHKTLISIPWTLQSSVTEHLKPILRLKYVAPNNESGCNWILNPWPASLPKEIMRTGNEMIHSPSFPSLPSPLPFLPFSFSEMGKWRRIVQQRVRLLRLHIFHYSQHKKKKMPGFDSGNSFTTLEIVIGSCVSRVDYEAINIMNYHLLPWSAWTGTYSKGKWQKQALIEESKGGGRQKRDLICNRRVASCIPFTVSLSLHL